MWRYRYKHAVSSCVSKEMFLCDYCIFWVSSLIFCFVCVEVLWPSQPNGVMSNVVSLPNHTLTGQAKSSKRLTSIVHILSPETDNCPSWISRRERMIVENISWSISMKECCQPRRGLIPQPPGLQSDGASNWATEATKNANVPKLQVTVLMYPGKCRVRHSLCRVTV